MLREIVMEWNGIWWNLTFHHATPVHVNSREIWSSVLQGKIYRRTHKNSNFTHIRGHILVQCDHVFACTPHIMKLTQKTRAIMMSCHPLAIAYWRMMALSSIIFLLCCLYHSSIEFCAMASRYQYECSCFCCRCGDCRRNSGWDQPKTSRTTKIEEIWFLSHQRLRIARLPAKKIQQYTT